MKMNDYARALVYPSFYKAVILLTITMEKLNSENIEGHQKIPKSFLLHIDNIDSEKSAGGNKPHSHDRYMLSFLYEGTMPHYADFEQRQVQGPALLILNIGQIHIHTPTIGCKVVSIVFSADFIHGENKELYSYLQTIFTQHSVSLTTAELTELDNFIQLIKIEYDKTERNLMIIKMLLNAIIIYCSKIVNRAVQPDNPKGELYHRFLLLLRENFSKYHQVTDYARTLNVSTDVLNQVVKDKDGKSPKQVIDEQLLLEAKRLLYWSESTVREIAWRLGFETDSYFSRFFKKYSGVTPMEFRNKSN
jgi:AraC-like DNA-binding protein